MLMYLQPGVEHVPPAFFFSAVAFLHAATASGFSVALWALHAARLPTVTYHTYGTLPSSTSSHKKCT